MKQETIKESIAQSVPKHKYSWKSYQCVCKMYVCFWYWGKF